MIPDEVLMDRGLSHRQIRVYGILAGGRRGAYASMGQRLMSQMAGLDRRSVREDVANLVTRGHLEVLARDGNSRHRYRLTSAVFNAAATTPAAKPETPAAPAAKAGALTLCGRCGGKCKGLVKSGICRSCNWKDSVARIARGVIREEIGKTA